MKIAVWHNLPSGGGKRVLHAHVAGLVGRGHHVESWCPVSADQSYLPLDTLVKEHVRPLDGWHPGPPDFWKKKRDLLDRGAHRITAMIRHSRQCADEIARGGFDLVFANTCQAFASPFIGRYVASPKLLYLQEPARMLYEALPELPWLAPDNFGLPWHHPRRLRARLRDAVVLPALRRRAREEVVNARAFDTVLVNSQFSRESTLRAYGVDARVCYLGIDTETFRPLDLERRRFVVALGSFQYTKGVDTAIEAVACLPLPRPPLVWIANASHAGGYVEQMTRLAREREVDLQLHLKLPDTEVVRLLNEAAVMLYTSRLEPFGLAPLEANACGTPVVAVAEGGVRETVRDGLHGSVVGRDPAQIAEALGRLLDDPAGARAIGCRAAEHIAQEWSVARSVDRLEAELERCVRRRA